MKPKYILALDQGTTSSRAVLFNSRCEIVSMSQRPFNQQFPQPGWVEHNPLEIWSTQSFVMENVVNKADIEWSDIDALGITNQRETTVVWDRQTSEPVYNAIVWQDRRTADYCDVLRGRGLTERIREKTGLILDAYFSATKIRWILDNVPGARARAERGELCFGTVDSWLAWRLSGGRLHIIDVSNARARCSSTSTPSTGTTNCSTCSTSAPDAARNRTHERRIRHDRLPAGTGADPDRLAGGRPAGRAFRAAVHPLLGQDDLRHGMLHHAQYGRPAPRLGQQPAGHRGVAARRQDDLCARRKRLCGRFGHPMAARRVETLLLVGRFGTAGRIGRRYGRRLSGTGTDGTGRSPTGTPMPAARSSASRAARPPRTSPGRRSKRSPSRSTTWYAPWRPIRDTPRPRCASTAVPWPTAC